MTTQQAAKFETIAVHGGSFRADPVTGAVVPPIYLTTSYQFQNTEHARRIFGLEELGYTYTRTVNPTREFLERRIAALEGGVGALALATGKAASLYALLNLARAGDNVVVSADIAKGRHAGLPITLHQLGIEVRLACADDVGSFVRLTDARTRAYFVESLSVPELRPFPIESVADTANQLGVPLIVDNTALPLSCRPFELRAAVVVYSAAEYLGGHGTTDGGLIVDGGGFSWEAHAARLPTLVEPDSSYHGVVWTELVKKWKASPFVARTRAHLLRDLGAAINPLAVFHLIQGIETLPLRLRRHNANAQQVAAYLAGHPKVSGLASGAALIGFDLADTQATTRFKKALWLFESAATYGGVRSAVIAPSTAANHVLLSIGLENPRDIIGVLQAALAEA
ncbi:O-acetylhomoserine (thiol)-lyase [Rhodopseudomonas rhenobacensis]|uniref:O-acetylhomoserine (Thiol)-lyase n=1 Tax=Rhodopseudomonas rhenobacensis TaxID=87461 RepID=A0A7W7Z2S6_9BRAD|nr:PLP-dependent transferase [Rhodopseudomonas rhenobacensis]MBB5046889.1 O-acetylhomoserine (thiol)-lyase [Rhodopseudomonas rhenobacensis]